MIHTGITALKYPSLVTDITNFITQYFPSMNNITSGQNNSIVGRNNDNNIAQEESKITSENSSVVYEKNSILSSFTFVPENDSCQNNNHEKNDSSAPISNSVLTAHNITSPDSSESPAVVNVRSHLPVEHALSPEPHVQPSVHSDLRTPGSTNKKKRSSLRPTAKKNSPAAFSPSLNAQPPPSPLVPPSSSKQYNFLSSRIPLPSSPLAYMPTVQQLRSISSPMRHRTPIINETCKNNVEGGTISSPT